MADEQVPIWDVIEEFKNKIKVQEIDLKKRREDVDARDAKLKEDERAIVELRSKLEAREGEVAQREATIGARESAVTKKERDLKALESDLSDVETHLITERAALQKRQAEAAERETTQLRLAREGAENEANTKAVLAHLHEIEERLLKDEASIRTVLEEMTAKREGLLVKAKVLEEQAAASSNIKHLMIEQQKQLVELERTLIERERALNERRLFMDSRLKVVSLPVEGDLQVSEPIPEERIAVALETKVDESIEMNSVPAPMEEESADTTKRPEEISCPRCKTMIDASSEVCWACGTNVNQAIEETAKAPEPAPEPEVKEEAPKEEAHIEAKPVEPSGPQGEVKKSVSIRKIIKRK
ncbi:MAG: hypothetical protein LLG16_00070 [Euryarchaeota archaeon]|nr:hypothetical protein [Euryarchaeota archaeon]